MTPWSRFREIKSALDREDIEGLLALECPSDEYDGEASLIESGVAKATNFGKSAISVEQVEGIVRAVWDSQFGPFDPPDLEKRRSGFASVAHRIAASL
jgi:hypothetical protein